MANNTLDDVKSSAPHKTTIYNELEQIQQKNNEQIQADIDLVNLYTCFGPDQIQTQPISEELKQILLNPSSLNESLSRLREETNSGNQAVSMQAKALLSEYDIYVRNLRDIRKLQRQEISNVKKLHSEDPKPEQRQAFMQSLAFSIAISEMVYMRLRDDGHLPPVQNDELIKATETPEGFRGAVEALAITNPKLLIMHLELYEQMFGKEDLQNIAKTILEGGQVNLIGLASAKPILELVPEEERQELATNVFKQFGTDSNSSLIVDKFIECVDIIGPEKSKEIASNALNGAGLGSREVKSLLGAGLLTLEQIQSAVASKINPAGTETIRNMRQLVDFVDGGLFEESQFPIRAMVENFIMDSAKILLDNPYDVSSICKFLGLEKSKQLHMLLFKLDPIEYEKWLGVGKNAELLDESSPAELTEIIKNNFSMSSGDAAELCETLMGSPIASVEEKKRWIQNYTDLRRAFLYDILGEDNPKTKELITQIYSPDEINEILQEVLLQNEDFTVTAAADILEFIPDNQKEVFINSFLQSRSTLSFASEYQQLVKDRGEEFFEPFLDKDKLENQLDIYLDSIGNKDYINLGWRELNSIKEIFGTDKSKQVVDVFLKNKPEVLIESLEFISQNYTPEESKQILLKLMEVNSNSVKNLIKNLNGDQGILSSGDDFKWPDLLPKQQVKEFLEKSYLSHPQEFVGRIVYGDLNEYFNESEIETLIDSLTVNHPLIILGNIESLSKKFQYITTEYIIQRSTSDKTRTLLAQKTTAGINKRLVAQAGTEAEEILFKQGKSLDSRLAIIRRSFTEESIQRLAEKLNITESTELEICDMLAFLGNTAQDPNSEISKVNSYEDLQILFSKELCKLLNVLTPEGGPDPSKLKDQMPVLSKVAVYCEALDNNPSLKPILSEFVQSLVDGQYDKWRFGEISEETLSELHRSELLPENLTLDQYRLWQQEFSTTREANQTNSVKSFIQNCQNIILENSQFLQDMPEDSQINTSSIESLKGQIGSIGESVGRLNKNLQSLRALEQSELTDAEISRITAEVAQLKSQQSKSQIQLAIISILNTRNILASTTEALTTEQSESIIKESKKHIATLSRLLTDEQTNGLITQLNSEIAALESGSSPAAKITISDKSDPRTTIEVGERPVGSCQSYRTGEFRECLMSYFNQNTKIILVENENGKPIARAVLRLLDSAQQGGGELEPCLFLETVYSAVGQDAVSDAIISHAAEKAKQLGIPLLISSKSQNEQGEFVSVEESENFKFTPSRTQLISRGSRAPYIYSDALGGSRKGKYKISGLALVESAKS